jgi:anaerobic ribonucleoside-triphosphate reductase
MGTGYCGNYSNYGVRDRVCPCCGMLLRSEDFTGSLCNWCDYDLGELARRIAALQERMNAGNTISGNESPAPARSTI